MKIEIETKGPFNRTTIKFNGEEKKLVELNITVHEGKGVKAQICELRDGRPFYHTLFNEDFRMYDEWSENKNLNKGVK